MKLLLFCLFFIFLSVVGRCQKQYVFDSRPVKYPEVKECPDDEYLSRDVRMKLAQFDLIYTKTIDPTSSRFIPSMEIIKPDLYYSVQKLSKYFCKCLKKGTIPKQEAENQFRNILDKCIQIFSCDTGPIEAELRATNDPKDIVSVFNKIVIR